MVDRYCSYVSAGITIPRARISIISENTAHIAQGFYYHCAKFCTDPFCMFAYIQGKLAHKDPTYAIIDVQGVGYEIRISLNTADAIGHEESCKLYTYLYVKEDAQLLFGFAEAGEKKLFLHLLSISGVGPSLALTILSSMSPPEIRNAIVQEDVKTIQQIKGIGGKTAQRIVLELKDRIKKEMLTEGVGEEKSGGISRISHNTLQEEALSALITLGLNRTAAEKSVQKALSEWQKKGQGTDPSLEELIKLALKTT